MIFNVVNNLKLNGTYYPAGSFITAEEASFPELVAEGVLSPVLGAENEEEAQAILEAAITATEVEVTEEPKNTWQAAPDPVVETTTTEQGAETEPQELKQTEEHTELEGDTETEETDKADVAGEKDETDEEDDENGDNL